MMVASWEGHLGIVEALISAEADTNLQDGVNDILYMQLQSLLKSVCVDLRPEGLILSSRTTKPPSNTDYTNLEYSTCTCMKHCRTGIISNKQVQYI